MGAKNGIFPADEKTFEYLSGIRGEPCAPDGDAQYAREVHIALDRLAPQVALPHQPGSRRGRRRHGEHPVQMVYLGTCTGGRVRDFHQARPC